MPPKKMKKMRKQKTTNKSKKNTIKQNVKINISTSGGSGGSGGTSVPNIPTPMQSFARSEKIGENVNVTNLLNRIGNQQTEAFNNFSDILNRTMRQQINRDDRIDAAEQINRDDRIDAAEHVNDGIDNNENIDDLEYIMPPSPAPIFFEEDQNVINERIIQKSKEKNESKKMGKEDVYSMLYENKLLNPPEDKSTEPLLKRIPTPSAPTMSIMEEIQKSPLFIDKVNENNDNILMRQKDVPSNRSIGGGGGGPTENRRPSKGIFENKLKSGFSYTFKQDGISLGTFNTLEQAEKEKQTFNITFPSNKPKPTRNEIQMYAELRKPK